MKEFYEFAEEVWMRPKSRSLASAGHGFLQKEDVERYFDILRRAREKAGRGSVYDQRISQIEYEMQPLKSALAGMKRTGPDLRGHIVSLPVQIDGDLTKPFWGDNREWRREWYTMGDLVTGQKPEKNRTKVSFTFTPDKSNLVAGVICEESRMDQVKAKAQADHDDPNIFNDDVIEIYIETPERSYFKIVVNSEGKIYDESQDVTIITRDTLPVLWNPGAKAAVKREKDRWTAEILIPTKDFGATGPGKISPWGVNVGRTRLSGSTPELYAISPTGKMMFAELSRLGNLSAW